MAVELAFASILEVEGTKKLVEIGLSEKAEIFCDDTLKAEGKMGKGEDDVADANLFEGVQALLPDDVI